jgi:type IV pilus assembly protein PilF
MSFYKLIAVLFCALLVGCVTTNSADMPKSDEDAARLNMDLGISYMRQGELDQAMYKLQKSIDLEPDNATAHRMLGMIYERMDDINNAEKEYRLAVRQEPDDAEALNQLGSFVCMRGDVRESLKYYDRALKIPRYKSRYLIYTNAGTCAKKFDLALAETYLRKGLAENAVYPEGLYQMADITYRREVYLQSRAFIQRRLAVAPASPDVLWLGYRIETALNDRLSAEDFSKRLLKEFPSSVEASLLLEMQRDVQKVG